MISDAIQNNLKAARAQYYHSPYILGRWRDGLNRDLATQIKNVEGMYRKGQGPFGKLQPYESTTMALVFMLDETDKHVAILAGGVEAQGARVLSLEQQLDAARSRILELEKELKSATVQPEVVNSVGSDVLPKPAASAARKNPTPKRPAKRNSRVVHK